MAFQDLLKKKVNNLGKELNELLERVLPLNDPDLVSLFVSEADQNLEPKIQGKLSELVKESPENLEKKLSGQDSEQMENLEKLADLFAELAGKNALEESDAYRKKALLLYQYITDKTATFSFPRMAKVAALKK